MSGNPVFPGWYADPELHLFEGRYYIYPTYSTEFDKQTFFDVWSSDNLVDWQNDGKILDFADIPWSGNRAAWAPSVASRNGLYYLYFSAGDGHGIGVATATSPTGPFQDALGKPLIGEYILGAQPIDAHAFLDDDGQAYLYYGGHRHALVVRLNDDMVSHQGDFTEITPTDYVEGPFMLKRNGLYYFLWSEGEWTNSTYAVAYARGLSPTGPFERGHIILESDTAVGLGAGHCSVLNIPGTDDWYMAYHRRPIDETHGDHRVVCIDRMYFDEAGQILPVVLTHTGVEAQAIGNHA